MSTQEQRMIPFPYTEEEYTPDGAVLRCLGDSRWANYHASAEIRFGADAEDNYAGVGLRGADGFLLRLYASGSWELRYRDEVLQSGICPDVDAIFGKRHTVGIGALGKMLLCFVDGETVAEMQLDRPIVRSGEMTLESAGYPNEFYQITAKSMPAFPGSAAGCCVLGTSSLDISYRGKAGSLGFGDTVDACDEAVVTIRFYGTAISLLGTAEDAVLAVWLDERLYSESHPVGNSRTREAFFTVEPISRRWHTLRIQVLQGKLGFEGYTVPTDDPLAAYDPKQFPTDPKSTMGEIEKHARERRDKMLPVAGAAAAGLAVAAAGALLLGKKKKK